MCGEGIVGIVMEDQRIRALLADPRLDLLHHQVVMSLYSMDATGHLADYRETLPLYLSMSWDECSKLVDTLVEVGVVYRTGDGIALTYPVTPPESADQCLCGA